MQTHQSFSFSNNESVSFGKMPSNLPRIGLALLILILFFVIPILLLNLPVFKEPFSAWIDLHMKSFIVLILFSNLFFMWSVFRISEWLAQYTAAPGSTALSKIDLIARIKNLNLNAPIEIIDLGSDKLVVKWNYANEHFKHLFGMGKIQKSYELLLKFSEHSTHPQVFASETMTSLELEAGGIIRPAAQFRYSFFKGISLFASDYSSGYGFTIKEGSIVFDELYTYSFNPDEMKAIIISTITLHGWNYSPKVFLK